MHGVLEGAARSHRQDRVTRAPSVHIWANPRVRQCLALRTGCGAGHKGTGTESGLAGGVRVSVSLPGSGGRRGVAAVRGECILITLFPCG